MGPEHQCPGRYVVLYRSFEQPTGNYVFAAKCYLRWGSSFQGVAHVTAGDVIYGFSALIKGTTNGGVIVLGSIKTVGGYHARVSTDEGGWLRITGKVRPETEVPTTINIP